MLCGRHAERVHWSTSVAIGKGSGYVRIMLSLHKLATVSIGYILLCQLSKRVYTTEPQAPDGWSDRTGCVCSMKGFLLCVF